MSRRVKNTVCIQVGLTHRQGYAWNKGAVKSCNGFFGGVAMKRHVPARLLCGNAKPVNLDPLGTLAATRVVSSVTVQF